MTPLVTAVLITLVIGGPAALWFGSQKRVDSIYIRHVVRGLDEAVDVLATRKPPAPAGWVQLRDGRICAAGSGARDVSAAPAPAASTPVVPALQRPPRQARRAVVGPYSSPTGGPTTRTQDVVA